MWRNLFRLPPNSLSANEKSPFFVLKAENLHLNIKYNATFCIITIIIP